MSQTVLIGDDGKQRCWWAGDQPDYVAYHDQEWGRPVTSDTRLLEKVCLEGFQAGLSWLTILRKRDRFREVFAGFDPQVVSQFTEDDILRLLSDSGIVRHRAKIEATINNAQRAKEVIETHGSLANYFWAWASSSSPAPTTIPDTTEPSSELSKQLKKTGWKFVGPTTIYAFMQATGLVNDHIADCWVREQVEGSRINTLTKFLPHQPTSS